MNDVFDIVNCGSPCTGVNESATVWIVVAAAAAVLIVGGLIAWIVVRNKSKKPDDN